LGKTIRSFPQNSKALAAFGRACSCTGQLGRAVNAYGKAVSVDPANPDFHDDLSHLYNRMGQVQLAEGEALIARTIRSALRNFNPKR
jgi:Flp pilus assembly protein TadD